jgi:glycosyltransferase involved in cell wall biosynthesis
MPVPTISVVMSVFNGERFLCEAIESILSQTVSDFEFVIIDDGSTDTSATILASYQQRDHRVRVYRQENIGLARSLNRGCGLARGNYIARMDADDVAHRDRLLWQLEFMEAHRTIGLVGGAVEFIDATGKGLSLARQPLKDCEIRRALDDSCVFWHPTTFIRKEVFDSVGGYRKVGDAEDYDLWLRIADKSELANLDAVVLKYRIHPYQVSVRKCRRQALGTIAARAAALSRRNGNPDPLDLIGEITPAALAALGASETMQATTLARGYLSCIRNMVNAGEYSLAFKELTTLQPSEIKHADAWVIADLRLVAARIYLHQHKFAKTMVNAGYAVITRPLILARPLKPLLRWFDMASRAIQEIWTRKRVKSHPCLNCPSESQPLDPCQQRGDGGVGAARDTMKHPVVIEPASCYNDAARISNPS